MNLDDIKRRMDGALSVLQGELGGLRTGRAAASMLDPVVVQVYGANMPINQVATISVTDARMITVSVWDRSQVGAVDRAIRESKLGLNPMVEGATMRIPIPELNQERRKDLAKVARGYAENAKVAVRQVRRDAMDIAKREESAGTIAEDEHRVLSDKIQKMTDQHIRDIDSALSHKEAEIMQV